MLIDCPCGATNRLPGLSAKKFRCGKCQHVFLPMELTKARPEPAPPRPEAPLFDEEPTHACKDEDDCGWEGVAEELEEGRCPECGKKTRKLED